MPRSLVYGCNGRIPTNHARSTILTATNERQTHVIDGTVADDHRRNRIHGDSVPADSDLENRRSTDSRSEICPRRLIQSVTAPGTTQIRPIPGRSHETGASRQSKALETPTSMRRGSSDRPSLSRQRCGSRLGTRLAVKKGRALSRRL